MLDLKQLFSNKKSSVHETCFKRRHFHKTNPYFYFCVFFRSLIISCIIPVGRKFRPWLNFHFCTVHPESVWVLRPKTKTTAKSNIFVPDHTFDWSISFVPNKVKIGCPSYIICYKLKKVKSLGLKMFARCKFKVKSNT